MDMLTTARQAREAARVLSGLSIDRRNEALLRYATVLEEDAERLFAANAQDLADAAELAEPLCKRLRFDAHKLAEVVAELRALAALPDPIGQTLMATELAPGLNLYRVRCPIGVVGVIFESRPDALVQIAALCLKSGNAVLLKGGREALHTNRALYEALIQAGAQCGLPEGWAGLMESRDEVAEMLALDAYIGLIIPRGSNDFVRYIMEHSHIPVLGHADGICSVYVDRDADLDKALRVTVDAKTQYVAVCNAAETLLVHRAVAPAFLPRLEAAMAEKGVELRGDELTRAVIPCRAATPEDYDTEFLDLILAVRVVEDLDAAITHIDRHGSGHTDVIVTENRETAGAFLSRVDSAGVFLNCSSRFADGFRYGFGAEVGISTGKLHARGPMGLEGLCTYKYKLLGQGDTVTAFQSGERAFTHRPLPEDCPL